MPLTITDIEQLDQSAVDQAADFIVAFVQDEYPNLDLTPGSVLYNTLIRPQAIYHALNQANMDRLRQSMSLLKLIEDPTLADEEIVDSLLSNYSVVRQDGTTASGQIMLILDELSSVAIPRSIEFSANGVTFQPTQSFSGVTDEADVLTSGDRLIRSLGNDQYSLTITVEATTAGAEGNVRKGTVFSTDGVFLQAATIIAAADFSGGASSETNEELLVRLQDGASTRNHGSRLTVRASLTDAFPSISDVSVIGAGDAEMRRDQHNTLGISSGGKADFYIRTRGAPQLTSITKTATLTDTATSQWTLNFTREEVPGFYRVNAVRQPSSNILGTLELVSDVRGIDSSLVTGLDFTPAMQGYEGVYTRYQTATIVFVDEDITGLVQGDTRDYDVDVLYVPELADVSDYTLHRDRRHPAGDYLVRAAIPCMVSIGVNITRGPGAPDVDTDAIKSSLVTEVNNVDFLAGRLPASLIAGVIQSHLTSRSRLVFPLDLRGQILRPDGSSWVFASVDNNYELVAPDLPEVSVTSRTTSFFLTADAITITVSPSDHLSV